MIQIMVDFIYYILSSNETIGIALISCSLNREVGKQYYFRDEKKPVTECCDSLNITSLVSDTIKNHLISGSASFYITSTIMQIYAF